MKPGVLSTRAVIVLVWPVMFALDFLIVVLREETWRDAREDTYDTLRAAWGGKAA